MKYKIKNRNLFLVDYLYNNEIYSLFIKLLIKNGKITISQKIFYNTINILKKKYKSIKKTLNILDKVIKKCSVKYEFIKKKIGNSLINIPILIKNKLKRYKLGIKLIIKYSKKRKEKNMFNKLANEIIDTYKKNSNTYKRKKEITKILILNKNYI
ncbi:MAG: hypothetical protein ABNO50_00690 [Candidatus Shikimatogenerans sp. Tduv]|uniref:Small ribosomal subunit protein uS7 domain-containing protein n=1 Tax=Candidatus Shikimatogenerans sp. Tduv TaxID=3158567 RepID=A0AAU7QR81_9FLAO